MERLWKEVECGQIGGPNTQQLPLAHEPSPSAEPPTLPEGGWQDMSPHLTYSYMEVSLVVAENPIKVNKANVTTPPSTSGPVDWDNLLASDV